MITTTDDIYRRDISKLKSVWWTAFRLTNLPHKDWGPRRRKDQTGRYAHLVNDSSQKEDQRTVVDNAAFSPDDPTSI